MAQIIVVEDNVHIREAVCRFLSLDGHDVTEFGGASGVIESVRSDPPALMILDVMLDDGDGFRLAQRIRTFSDVPIIFLTARDTETDRITGFEIGADDYVMKPFSVKELVLRVRALLKRVETPEQSNRPVRAWRFLHDTVELDIPAHRARLNGTPLELTSGEWEILCFCAERAPHVVSREAILERCLGHMHGGSERTVDTHLFNLRGKLGNAAWFETVRGYGYRFAGEPLDE